jgi:hypothetical protein
MHLINYVLLALAVVFLVAWMSRRGSKKARH